MEENGHYFVKKYGHCIVLFVMGQEYLTVPVYYIGVPKAGFSLPVPIFLGYREIDNGLPLCIAVVLRAVLYGRMLTAFWFIQYASL